MSAPESICEEAEQAIENDNIEQGVSLLKALLAKTEPTEPSYIESAALLLGTLKWHLHKTDRSFLDKAYLDAVFEPYLNHVEETNCFPEEVVAFTDVKNPPGLWDFMENEIILGHYKYHLATLRGDKWLSYISDAENHFTTLVETIQQYKHRMDKTLDVILCTTYNNLGNTMSERARFFCTNPGNKLFPEFHRYYPHLKNVPVPPEQIVMSVGVSIITKAKGFYMMCLENNLEYNQSLTEKETENIKKVREDARANMKYVQRLLKDPYMFIDSYF